MLDQLLAAVDGAGTIIPVSGYRPQTEQQAIWDDTLAEHGSAFTETYVARPGCSEHQTGLAIDLGENAAGGGLPLPRLPRLPAPAGPCAAGPPTSALSFATPRGKEAVTGIGYEPWHFRYVGWPHARLMEERHLVLEEYLAWLHDFPLGAEPLRYPGAGAAV